MGNPSLNHRYRKGFYSLFKTLQQNPEHRTIKYLNNLIEQDHRPVKRRNKFYRSLRTASTTIKGMEAIRGLYKKTRKEGTLFGFSVCTEIKVLLGIPA
ncbi:DDE-type integrase/transposase/recombinase (plasmid) [Enterococcus faecium]